MCENSIFVAYKPRFISSNKFLNSLKRKYKIKKMGFSGTLDPFAEGCLIVATNQYTKLFRFLKKTPKVYEATILLGMNSTSLDIENVKNISFVKPFSKEFILEVLNSFLGKQTQLPPKYSAKKISGVRAYKIESDDVYLKKEIEIEIFDIKLIDYSHPFLSFEVSVSEGSYIRSLGFDISKKLGVDGSLVYLKRVREGEFFYDCEKRLNILDYLDLKRNVYLRDENNLLLGKKLSINDFEFKEDGIYLVEYNSYFAVIEIKENVVKYVLNKICKGSV